MSERTKSIGEQLDELDRLMERAEHRAVRLRNQLSHGAADDLHAVPQLSNTLDRILQLKLSRDLLAHFMAFDSGLKRSVKGACGDAADRAAQPNVTD